MKKLVLLLVFIFAFVLRFYKLAENPPSLSWDEASLGYNAYAIATSLRDEHGEYLPSARFIAFGDYKPPGYIYATVPSIVLFGLNEFATRLPSALAGLGMVIFTYLLVVELLRNAKIALLSSFLIGISAWSLHLSRAAYESNLASFFNLVGVYFFCLSARKKWAIVVSIVAFVLSFYTFNANRIIAPLLLTSLSILYLKEIVNNKKWLFVAILLGFFMVLPSIPYLQSRESKLRFQEVSIFNNLAPIKLSNERIAADGGSLVARIIHNRRVLFATDFLKHYFDNFSGRFLFTHGDVNPRLSVQDMGELYAWELPFLILGIFWLIKKRERGLLLLTAWMVIVPIPAATARETPHALRILSILPTFQIIIAFGVYQIVIWAKKSFSSKYCQVLFFFLCSFFFVNFYYYLHNYYIHYPRDWNGEWQYGYKQIVAYVLDRIKDYDDVFVTDALGRPYIYFAFYSRYPMTDFLNDRQAQRDWYGFWNVYTLGKIKFGLGQLPNATGKILLVTTPDNLPGNYHLLTTVQNLSGKEVFLIAEKI